MTAVDRLRTAQEQFTAMALQADSQHTLLTKHACRAGPDTGRWERTMSELADINELVGVDAGDGAAGNVAHIVHAAHDAGQAMGHQALNDLVSLGQSDAPQLDVGTCCDVPAPILHRRSQLSFRMLQVQQSEMA